MSSRLAHVVAKLVLLLLIGAGCGGPNQPPPTVDGGSDAGVEGEPDSGPLTNPEEPHLCPDPVVTPLRCGFTREQSRCPTVPPEDREDCTGFAGRQCTYCSIIDGNTFVDDHLCGSKGWRFDFQYLDEICSD